MALEVDALTDQQVLERYSSPGGGEAFIREKIEEVRESLSLGAQLHDEQESAEVLSQITQDFLERVAEQWRTTVADHARQQMSIEDMRAVLRFKEEHPGLHEREAEFRDAIKTMQPLWMAKALIELSVLMIDHISKQRENRAKSST